MPRALLLDRDGTVMEDTGYVRRAEDVRLLPGAAAAMRELRARGFKLALVSNQSGVARGIISPAALASVHARLCDLLALEGVAFDGAYYCVHGPEDGCACRKPQPGLIEQAARELDLDLSASYMVGDKASDVQAGQAAGCRVIFFRPPDSAAVPTAHSWDDVVNLVAQQR